MAFILVWFSGSRAAAWDTFTTHEDITEFAFEVANDAEANLYIEELVIGGNTEIHELPLTGDHRTKFGIDMEAKRVWYDGKNWGVEKPERIWFDALTAYSNNNKILAYFYLGVLLHQVEDMGVPSHANHLYHQFTPGDLSRWISLDILNFDNLEAFFALSATILPASIIQQSGRTDPHLASPADYFEYSRQWTLSDSSQYPGPDDFPFVLNPVDNITPAQLLWATQRYARTCTVTYWTLLRALAIFKNIDTHRIVQTPLIVPGPGTYYKQVSAVLSTRPSDSPIMYTLDGSQPAGNNGTAYNRGIVIDQALTLKAKGIAKMSGWSDSQIGVCEYHFQASTPLVEYSPSSPRQKEYTVTLYQPDYGTPNCRFYYAIQPGTEEDSSTKTKDLKYNKKSKIEPTPDKMKSLKTIKGNPAKLTYTEYTGAGITLKGSDKLYFYAQKTGYEKSEIREFDEKSRLADEKARLLSKLAKETLPASGIRIVLDPRVNFGRANVAVIRANINLNINKTLNQNTR